VFIWLGVGRGGTENRNKGEAKKGTIRLGSEDCEKRVWTSGANKDGQVFVRQRLRFRLAVGGRTRVREGAYAMKAREEKGELKGDDDARGKAGTTGLGVKKVVAGGTRRSDPGKTPRQCRRAGRLVSVEKVSRRHGVLLRSLRLGETEKKKKLLKNEGRMEMQEQARREAGGGIP